VPRMKRVPPPGYARKFRSRDERQPVKTNAVIGVGHHAHRIDRNVDGLHVDEHAGHVAVTASASPLMSIGSRSSGET